MCVHRVWFVYRHEYVCVCECVTPVCVPVSKEKQNQQSQNEDTHRRSKPRPNNHYILYKNQAFFPKICHPCLHLYARHGSKQHCWNRSTQTTTTTNQSSKQRRRLCISLFSSQQTKWLPNEVNNISESNRKDPAFLLWKASRKDF